MGDETIADLLALLGIINKHDIMGYSVKPHGKMCFLASEIIRLPTVVHDAQAECLRKGFPLRFSYRDDRYIVIVEKAWITIENEDLDIAIVEACATALEGVQNDVERA